VARIGDNFKKYNGNDRLNKLETELETLSRTKEQIYSRIEELNKLLNDKKSRVDSIERSLVESNRIAGEIEQSSLEKAIIIQTGAEASVAANKARISVINEEIAGLLRELESYKFDDRNDREETRETGVKPVYPKKNNQLIKKENEPFTGDTRYNIKLVSFVNARHYVVFGNKTGPVHAHSWQVVFQVRVSSENQEITEFSLIFRAAVSALTPYENTILNQVPPFDKIQPTTENIAMYFYNRLEDVLSELKLELVELTLWETPTRGIHVSGRNPEFDKLSELGKEVDKGYEQAAAVCDLDVAEFSPEISPADQGVETGDSDEKKSVLKPLPDPVRPAYSLRQYLVAFVIIIAVSIFAYYSILFPASEQHYPWGSDSWGHLYKAESLYKAIQQGNYYPQFTEYWYNGTQPFRYWAPAPYYVLALFRAVTGDIFRAGNWYIFACALFGGLSWLFLSSRMGLWPAMMAGIVWVGWQDNVRVAFSEGNLPRVLATALLPVVFYLFFCVLKKRSFLGILFAVFLVHLTVICHAMIGAIYCLCLLIFAFFLWVFHGCSLGDLLRGVLVLVVGVLSSSWWLLPSLTGGITGINAEAVKEVIQFVPSAVSLNPMYRFSNVETFYWGIVLVILLVLSFITWRSKPPWAKSLSVCGLILILITFPLIRELYIILPLSHLLWPLRFTSFAALAVLAAGLTFNLPEDRQNWLKSSYNCGLVIVVSFLLLTVDCWFSLSLLAHTGSKPFNIIQGASYIKQEPGWRVATIDISRLGSAPSYILSKSVGLEQVFGWAWQGAVTSRNIMLLNTGLENQYYPFLFRSCVDLGATDLIVKEDVIEDIEDFRRSADLAGYRQQAQFGEISVWRSVSGPYLVVKKPECLVIGKYAGTIALQFPGVEMGISPYIDHYSVVKLSEYNKVILSGATWRSKRKAEQIIKDYVAAGGEVFVELGGMPENVLAKQPEFLGVYGEPVSYSEEIEIRGENKRVLIPPVSDDTWKAYVPIGLDKVELGFYYYGNQAPVYGYKIIDDYKIRFIGYNLTYHAYKTGDSGSFRLIKDIFDLESGYNGEQLIPLQSYKAGNRGYKMKYQINEKVEAVVPVALHDGLSVRIDGEVVPFDNYENLVQLKLPSGTHEIEILLEKTAVYRWGAGLSVISFLLLFAGLVYYRKKTDGS